MLHLNAPEIAGLNLYDVFWTLAWIAGLGGLARLRRRRGEAPGVTLLLGAGLFVYAVIGGRIFYFLNHPRRSVTEAFGPMAGGLALWGSIGGGLIFAALFSVLFGRRAQQKFRDFFLSLVDDLSLAAPLAIAMGRVGCFFQGCCHGLPARWSLWAVTYHSPAHSTDFLDVPLVPLQLIESAGLLGIAVLQSRLASRLRPSFVFLSSYSLLRGTLEFYRGDEIRGIWGPLSAAQWTCLGVLALSFFWFFFASARPKKA